MNGRRSVNLSISTLSHKSGSPSPIHATLHGDPEKNTLLFPPPLYYDAGLPSPLIKHAQQLQARRPALYRRLSTFLIAALLFGSCIVWRLAIDADHTQPYDDTDPALRVLESINSTAPEAVQFVDAHGHNRWTVSIPPTSTFPLSSRDYEEICFTSRALTSKPALRQRRWLRQTNKSPYYAQDAAYMQVHDALSQGILAPTNSTPIQVVGRSPQRDGGICPRSLTFVLDSDEAGFGKALLSLWLSYGLARREKRAFFIEDSRWQYGTYLSFFPSPPQPACLPPPASQVVPCPHQAAHLVVSSATVPHTFGPDFHSQFQAAYRTGLSRHREIFRMAREGYEALFALGGEDAAYSKHQSRTMRERATSGHYPIIGVHARRGDRHPFEYEFNHDYLPLERFAGTASDILSSHPSAAQINTSDPIPLYLASDDPDLAGDSALLPGRRATFRLARPQMRIVLASKRNFLPATRPAERVGNPALTKYTDEASGWEGGFYAALFRNLGRARRLPRPLTFSSAREQRQQMDALWRASRAGGERSLSDEERLAESNAAALRQLVGRGYLLDIDVLARSDAVVCAVSSATCRVLGVMMGWDRVARGEWVNVDDGRGWSWDGEH